MKEEEKVIQKYRGYNKDENYNREIEQARTKDHASYGSSSPVHHNPEIDSCYDDCHAKCMGCCGHDEHNPENNSWCTIL